MRAARRHAMSRRSGPLTLNEDRTRQFVRDGRSGAPVARQIRREHAHRGGHERDQHRDHERVEGLGPEGPEDEPDDQAEGGGEDDAHGRGTLADGAAGRVVAVPAGRRRGPGPLRPGAARAERPQPRNASAISSTTSRTAAAGSAASPAARTSRLPTMTPSAPAAAACAACSGVAMPKPRATGAAVWAFARATTPANAADRPARSPVVPVTDTV